MQLPLSLDLFFTEIKYAFHTCACTCACACACTCFHTLSRRPLSPTPGARAQGPSRAAARARRARRALTRETKKCPAGALEREVLPLILKPVQPNGTCNRALGDQEEIQGTAGGKPASYTYLSSSLVFCSKQTRTFPFPARPRGEASLETARARLHPSVGLDERRDVEVEARRISRHELLLDHLG